VRQVSGAGAVEAPSLHCRKPVGVCLVGAVASRIDARSVYLHWDVNDQVHLDALGWVLIALAAAMPVVLLLL
jgi:hypothetical protein